MAVRADGRRLQPRHHHEAGSAFTHDVIEKAKAI